jgi:hypothetical protein
MRMRSVPTSAVSRRVPAARAPSVALDGHLASLLPACRTPPSRRKAILASSFSPSATLEPPMAHRIVSKSKPGSDSKHLQVEASRTSR